MATGGAGPARRPVTTGAGAPPVPRVLRALAGRMADEHSVQAFQRDPDHVARWLPVLAGYTRYFSPEVRGLDNLPVDGPVLVVGNHSGLFYLADACVVLQAVLARRGLDRPTYSLTYDLLLAVPWYGRFLRRLGAIPAGNPEADAAVAQDAALLVFPGGDWESCRPWRERDRVDFAGRQGFVRLALRHGLPVVPVVSHGAHHSVVVLSRGERLARRMHLAGMHVHVFPLVLGPPLGVTPVFALPLPAKLTVQFLPALRWDALGPGAADDPAVVRACYDEVTAALQAGLDRLGQERPHPLLAGSVDLVRGVASLLRPPSRTRGRPG